VIITVSLRNKALIFIFTYIFTFKPVFEINVIMILVLLIYQLAAIRLFSAALICSFSLSQPSVNVATNIFHLYFLQIICFSLESWRMPWIRFDWICYYRLLHHHWELYPLLLIAQVCWVPQRLTVHWISYLPYFCLICSSYSLTFAISEKKWGFRYFWTAIIIQIWSLRQHFLSKNPLCNF
jgi:hypothetical protein